MLNEHSIIERLAGARAASQQLALCSTEAKNRALMELARAIRNSHAKILEANGNDLEHARRAGTASAMLDRLTLSPARIAAMAEGVEKVIALPDPVGEVIASWQRPNGLKISQVRVPIGLIAIIFEARPNVTIDASALLLKSGNAMVLRGGKEALSTNSLLAGLLAESLHKAALPPDAVYFIDSTDREVVQILKRQAGKIDLIIPRGGKTLKAALENSAVPLLPHFDGLCHTYVDRAANLAMAEAICINAKCNRPAVCNAMETLLVHREVAAKFLPALGTSLRSRNVEIRGDQTVCGILDYAERAGDQDWDTEYLDLILSIKVVDSVDEAIAFITRHGSGLADAIVTEDTAAAQQFEQAVDSATVYVNASTRFTDGFEFGFGAETGISTNRLHARGPMGLRELTTYKYIIRGSGQVR